MRVAIVTETWLPSVDGVVTRLVHTVEHLVAAGHDILVLAPTAGPAMRGVTQLTLPGLALPLIDRRRRVAVPTRQPLQAAVATFAPDVVHVVNPVAMGAGAVRLLAPRYPLVASFHTDLEAYLTRYGLNPLGPVLRSLMRNAYRHADLVLATSPTGQRRLGRLGVRADLWPAAVDTAVFTAPNQNGAADRPAGRSEVVCVGRLAPEKNLELLADVLRAGLQSGLNWRLTFVGDGPERRRLQRRFSGLPVVFAGSRPAAEVADAYRTADAVIMPSRTETVGLVLLEAAACGAPIVAADTPSSRHTLRGYPAVLVPAGASPSGWVRAIDDACRRRPPAPAAVASWGEVTVELIAAYRVVVDRRRRDRRDQADSRVRAPSATSAGRTARRSCAADS